MIPIKGNKLVLLAIQSAIINRPDRSIWAFVVNVGIVVIDSNSDTLSASSTIECQMDCHIEYCVSLFSSP